MFSKNKSQTKKFKTAPKITADITDIQWHQLSAEQIYNRHRALYGFKHLNARFEGKVVHLLELRIPYVSLKSSLPYNCASGSFLYQRSRQSLLVRCDQNTELEILSLRIEGKKPMSAMEFNNGYLRKLKNKNLLLFTNKLSLQS